MDDDPLPSEQKILALHQIDQTILPWMKGMVEREQKHRHDVTARRLALSEKTQQDDQRDRTQRRRLKGWGMVTSVLLFIGSAGGAIWLIYLGHPEGTALVGIPVMVVIAAMVSGKKIEAKK